MPAFEIGPADFLLAGRPHRILSGAIHYFRVHPGQWADRIDQARRLGLNTIETYVPWNYHEPRPGQVDTAGPRDIGHFLDLVAQAGLHAIVRPGPYICAEWTGGGLPSWLTADPSVQIRRLNRAYLAAVERYFAWLLPIVAQRQVTRGGPVILVQVENEYGAYGQDQAYLRELVRLTRQYGIEVPLFTCDQANDQMLAAGGLPELFKAATFGSRSPERLATLRRHQPDGPLFCAEYWDGWFDSWGQHHHTTPAPQAAADLDALLAAGASVNLYMFHGGTNYGLTAGANDKGNFAPITTSYDYDAPLREDGSPGPKYHAFREVIGRYAPVPGPAPAARPPAPAFEVPLRRGGDFWDLVERGVAQAGGWREAAQPPSLEELDPAVAFGLYRTTVAPADVAIQLADIRDVARPFAGGRALPVAQRVLGERTIALPPGYQGEITILAQNLGRVDYGPRIGEPTGLIGPATGAAGAIGPWLAAPLDLAALPAWPGATVDGPELAAGPVVGPVVLWAQFDAPAGGDLYLDVSGLGHGLAWLNGQPLGLYWSAGPTKTMYVPGPAVRAQGNQLVLLELVAAPRAVARFAAHHDLGHTEF
ncbi:MAG: beta-galactosidase [Bifidobacteriaceae bacterium]|jgi:beta-galactosidase|nr:beta-galactosidase [Bifidobacteriaceae bacterium]